VESPRGKRTSKAGKKKKKPHETTKAKGYGWEEKKKKQPKRKFCLLHLAGICESLSEPPETLISKASGDNL